jgi:esterase/lipase superfamily enzyme
VKFRRERAVSRKAMVFATRIRSPQQHARRRITCTAWLLMAGMLLATTGCTFGPPQLMPTPNIYATGQREPFVNVPPELRNNHVDVLYLTDRANESGLKDNPKYGYKRSRSLAMGVAEVEFGKNVSWDQLVEASTTSHRKLSLPMNVVKTTEVVRFPPTPKVLIELPDVDDPAAQAATLPSGVTPITTRPTTQEALRREIGDETRLAMAELSARLAKTPDKDVDVFIHGYNNTFDDSVTTIAQIWHFMGREGVPVAYSWPAGYGGLRGYTYDRESGEFTVYHLKQMLRVIAACPDVRRVNIIAHSRGTDVTLTALRELHLAIAGETPGNFLITRQRLKLGTLVLAAPDMDTSVVIQRMVTARVGLVPEHFVMYTCPKDEALGIASWLFGSLMRLGKLEATIFTPQELAALRASKTVQIIQADIHEAGSFGHDYFHSSPAVSSDLILTMRYHAAPGEENGRPLGGHKRGFWVIDDRYPRLAPSAALASDHQQVPPNKEKP